MTTSGETREWTRTAESGRNLTFRFCPECGTTVWWTAEFKPDHVIVALGCFERPDLFPPATEHWTEDRLDWIEALDL